MLPTLFLILQSLLGASASIVHVRQTSDSIASNVPNGETYNEPARGEGRRVLVYGRPDLALTVLGEPAAGASVGVAYTLDLGDANVNRQLFDVNLHDGEDRDDDDDDQDNDYEEPNQFDYNDDDELRLRGTQLCVTLSNSDSLTLEDCSQDREDDNNWIQDWSFDDQNGQRFVSIEDDDNDRRCLTASLDEWSNDQAQLTVDMCDDANNGQRFYQVLPGASGEFGTTTSGSPSSITSGGSNGTPTQSAISTQSSDPTGTSIPGSTTSPNAASSRANMWGRSFFRLLAEL